jgi:hypothetical protein
MKFKTEEERLNFYDSIDLDESVIVFKKEKKVTTSDEGCGCGGEDKSVCSCDTLQTEDVKAKIESSILIESFSDCPEFVMESTDDDVNTFFVKDYEAVPNSCGTGKIELSDRTSYMNMCEMDNNAVVDLTVVFEGKRISNIPFVLKKTDKEPRLVISKVHLV